MAESELVTAHLPCPNCSSTDGYALYSDGHGYCFSCGIRVRSDKKAPQDKAKKVGNKNLIENVECKSLNTRKLTKKICDAYGYGVATYKGSAVQVAPYYSKKNKKLQAQHLRFADKGFAFLGNTDKITLFGQHLWSGTGKQLIITEGEIDCMSIAQILNLKWPTVSLPNGAEGAVKSIRNNLDFVNGYDTIVLAFDDDEAGHKAVEEVVQILEPGKVKLFAYPNGFKDANEILQASQGAAIIDAVWKNAKVYRPDGIVDGKDTYTQAMKEPNPGWTIPFPILNKKLMGMRKGELYMFTAGSGIGKSTLVKELAYHMMMEHVLKVGEVSLEENTTRTARTYMGIHLSRDIKLRKPQDITQAQMDEAWTATAGSGKLWIYDHWGSMKLDNLLSKLRYLALGLEVDWIVLDHISIVVSGLDEFGTDERKLIDKLMTRLRSLVEETGVGVMAIVHLKRPGNEGKSYNEGRTVNLTSLRGSASLEQLSDVVIALERDQQGDDPDVSVIRVLKNRPIGITGVADTLKYSHETGRLLTEETQNLINTNKEEKEEGENDDF